MTVHWYPAYSRTGFTAQELLSEGLMREAVRDYKNLLTWTSGLPVLVSEANSKSKGGMQGISDAFAAALWTTDYAFELATAGGCQKRVGGLAF